ncbi:NADH-quinone oxidoreductase subunit L [Ferrovibrio terrae]|uniref:NADH-ubiquinone oxidoreductase chain 5 n=1 Tax=Ferrovibrio terrae TaxID=2594003 RepID=A0A516H7U4_9PROT|nr:NADH-quinone oxidoreductase subunit L [Ferrovibrio terrae]QDO99818.1 NADH-quinone oxidoreductase subunit L [Ferrovibrio terrae]
MYHLIVFLPLLAAIIAGLFGRRIGDVASMAVTCVAVIISAVLSWVAFYLVISKGMVVTVKVLDWIDSGTFSVDWALKIDQLTAVMLVVVNTVSAVVHVYSVGYMSHDPHRSRFFSYLSLFTFAMLMLITADNFVQLYMGWEGVGLASYLLIGFWFHKPSANAASIKAFVVNRVGDFGFALGIMALFFATGSVTFEAVFAAAPDLAGKTFHFLWKDWDILTVATFLLFLGAMGKSAQLGLHTWLPDAMEGPTPVSALIHAATMVTAGVFMVARCSPLFEYAPDTLAFVTVIGASTAFFAATVGLAQNDIKRVIAYSTCSQLGYMFFALGVSAYPAAIFHLFTHAFFKALLFLGAGSVIHAVDGEQDMRRMGGLWKHIKITYAMMWIGSLALAGFPIFAGYYSKDMILEVAYAAGGVGQYAYIMGMAAAILTAFYSWRLLFMTFHGKPRADHHVMEHVHESPMVMLIPLFVLATGAVLAGIVFYDGFVGHHWKEFWGSSILILENHKAMDEAHHVPFLVKVGPIIVGVIGIFIAWIAYIRDTSLPGRTAAQHHMLYSFLLNKWYFDELYDRVFVRPTFWLGNLLWKGGDGKIIDGLGPDGLAATVVRLARRASILQSGYVYHYAFAMLIGVAVLVTYFFSAMGH